MFVIRDGNGYVCQLTGERFPYSCSAEKEPARAAAQARVDSVIFRQSQAGVCKEAGLAERKRLYEIGVS